jgi:hypothetical protein
VRDLALLQKLLFCNLTGLRATANFENCSVFWVVASYVVINTEVLFETAVCAHMVEGQTIPYTGVPPYPLIQYPRLQLSAVYRSQKKVLKIKEINGS